MQRANAAWQALVRTRLKAGIRAPGHVGRVLPLLFQCRHDEIVRLERLYHELHPVGIALVVRLAHEDHVAFGGF